MEELLLSCLANSDKCDTNSDADDSDDHEHDDGSLPNSISTNRSRIAAGLHKAQSALNDVGAALRPKRQSKGWMTSIHKYHWSSFLFIIFIIIHSFISSFHFIILQRVYMITGCVGVKKWVVSNHVYPCLDYIRGYYPKALYALLFHYILIIWGS